MKEGTEKIKKKEFKLTAEILDSILKESNILIAGENETDTPDKLQKSKPFKFDIHALS